MDASIAQIGNTHTHLQVNRLISARLTSSKPGLEHTNTLSCLATLVRTFTDRVYSLAPYPNLNRHNCTPNLNLCPNPNPNPNPNLI